MAGFVIAFAVDRFVDHPEAARALDAVRTEFATIHRPPDDRRVDGSSGTWSGHAYAEENVGTTKSAGEVEAHYDRVLEAGGWVSRGSEPEKIWWRTTNGTVTCYEKSPLVAKLRFHPGESGWNQYTFTMIWGDRKCR